MLFIRNKSCEYFWCMLNVNDLYNSMWQMTFLANMKLHIRIIARGRSRSFPRHGWQYRHPHSRSWKGSLKIKSQKGQVKGFMSTNSFPILVYSLTVRMSKPSCGFRFLCIVELLTELFGMYAIFKNDRKYENKKSSNQY